MLPGTQIEMWSLIEIGGTKTSDLRFNVVLLYNTGQFMGLLSILNVTHSIICEPDIQ